MTKREENGCDCSEMHKEIAKKVSETMPADSTIFDLADLFKLFGDSTRLKILLALERNEMCVFNISMLLNMSMSAVSHQLKPLRDAKLIRARREGKTIYYSLDDEHVSEIMSVASAHLSENVFY